MKLIKKGEIEPNDVGLIMSSANGSILDIAELNAYSELFNGDISIFNVKSFFGECFGFSNILQVAFGARFLQCSDIKYSMNLASIEKKLLDTYENDFSRPLSNVLISGIGLDGNAGALLLKTMNA
jgi:hypothetical protein